MSCILRFIGPELDIDAVLTCTDLLPDQVHRKDDPIFEHRPQGRRHERSSVTFLASSADLDAFDTQVTEATGFLERHSGQIREMAALDSVDTAALDFGIKLRSVAMHGDILPPRFLAAAAAAGVTVMLSHYHCSE